MKIQYSPDADVLMLVLKDDPPVNAIAEPGGILAEGYKARKRAGAAPIDFQ